MEINDAIAIFGFGSEQQTNLKPFHLESPWGATLMPLNYSVLDDLGKKQNTESG